jgi:protein arginine N-methyltransferase 1
MDGVPAPRTDSDYYFDSYSHLNIHEDMLKDTVRTLAYCEAIRSNPSLFAGKVVLDVGCGTGILSLFAARSGARKVFGVENSSIVGLARQLVECNGYADQIELIQGQVEQVTIPEPVDVVLSEWMGYCLFYESMLPSVLAGRDRFMKPGGKMFPSRTKMFIAAAEALDHWTHRTTFWDDVEGFSYGALKRWVMSESAIVSLSTDQVLTDAVCIKELALDQCSVDEIPVDSEFSLVAMEDQTVHGFVVWFDCFFEGPEKVVTLSTSPYEELTHWSQTLFYLQEPFDVSPGMTIDGRFEMRPNPRNRRDQNFLLTWNVAGQTHTQRFTLR